MNLRRLRRRTETITAPVDHEQRLGWRLNALGLDYPHPRTRALLDDAPDSPGATR
ncbi:hypothetical protein JMUB6875_45590 [Nocardia sp. JMUB6875]|uniref:hypothetical protein n=1 Tax=Nocardia sp. JMUB6875 TaxID=3158170 RepID=UPI0032E57C1F